MKQLFHKYRDILSYLFFGLCTTIANILVYYACAHWGGLSIVTGTVIAWVSAVVFAYFTNKIFVFGSRSWNRNVLVKEILSFFACRGVTGVMDILIMYVGVNILHIFDVGVKVFSNILVIILNYLMSKLLIFRKSFLSDSK